MRESRSWWQQFRRVASGLCLKVPYYSPICHFSNPFLVPYILLQPATCLRAAIRHRTAVFWSSITGQNSTRLQHRVARDTSTILASTSHLPHQHYPRVLLLSSSSALRISRDVERNLE